MAEQMQMQKLAEQAGFCHDINHGIYLCSPMHIQKFAELIVRECSQFVEDKFDFCGDELIIAEQILKHFGVEE